MRKHTLCAGLAVLALAGTSASAVGPGIMPADSDAVVSFSANAVLPDASAELSVSHSTSNVAVDNFLVAPEGYCINQENYYKLRDLAFLLTGKNTAFDVVWDDEHQCISMISGRDYTIAGGEMAPAGDAEIYKFVPSYSEVRLDGQAVQMTGYNINNNNYYRIRDVGPLIGFGVDWDNDSATVVIDSKSGTDAPAETVPPDSIEENGSNSETGSDQVQAIQPDTDPANPTDQTGQELPGGMFAPGDTTVSGDASADPSGDGDSAEPTEKVYPWIGPKIDGVLTILLDPGHGGTDPGCFHPVTNQNENHTNLQVAQYLKEMLESSGVRVILSRTDTTTTLQGPDRKEFVRSICEQGELDLVFSIHHNGFNRKAHGSEIYVQAAGLSPEAGTEGKTDPSIASKALGNRLLRFYMDMNVGLVNCGVKETSGKYMVYTSGEYGIPAVLSEFCFIDHDDDVKLIDEPHELQAEAKAMYDAIMAFYASTPY